MTFPENQSLARLDLSDQRTLQLFKIMYAPQLVAVLCVNWKWARSTLCVRRPANQDFEASANCTRCLRCIMNVWIVSFVLGGQGKLSISPSLVMPHHLYLIVASARLAMVKRLSP